MTDRKDALLRAALEMIEQLEETSSDYYYGITTTASVDGVPHDQFQLAEAIRKELPPVESGPAWIPLITHTETHISSEGCIRVRAVFADGTKGEPWFIMPVAGHVSWTKEKPGGVVFIESNPSS